MKLPLIATPREADLEITSRCNLRCAYCYYFDNPGQEYADLPTAEWVRFLGELGDCQVMQVSLCGGEPFIRRDLPEIIQAVVDNRMRYSILSNGSLITQEMARFIASTRRCNQIQISVDGPNPEVHDHFRGEGSFAGAVRGLRLLQQENLPVTVRLTIHRGNRHAVRETVRFLLEDLGLRTIGTNSAGFFGSCRLNASEVQLTTEDRSRIMTELLELSEVYPGRIGAMAGPLADARSWRRMEQARLENGPRQNGRGFLSGCRCPYSKISVRSDGAIVPCSMIAHQVLGWMNRDSLLEIWRGSEDLNRLRSRMEKPLEEIEFCRDCPYIPYCTGNCPGLAYSMVGSLEQPSPDGCLRNYLADGGEIP